jgi:hypothetical protein
MSDQNVKGKSKYEAPVLVPLGEIAKGSGACAPGSGGAPVTCAPGAGVEVSPIDCTAGASASTTCTAGGTASTACTAGTSALTACTDAGVASTGACTAGVSAVSACTAGGSVGT